MSPTQPSVSVIIPTYNHGHLIEECLESLRSQTISNWEAIIVNNYSQDNTEEIISNLHDSRIRLIRFRNNGVIAASRNQGVRLARAPYVAFLDSDDKWYPNKLASGLRSLNSGFDIVCHAEKWVSKDGFNRTVQYGPSGRAEYARLLFDGNCLSTSAIMMTIILFNEAGGFSEDPTFTTAEDYDLWLKIAWLKSPIHFIDTVLGEYRIHGGNQSLSAERHYNAVINVLNYHFSRHVNMTYFNKLRIKRRLALASCGCGRMLQTNNQFREAYVWLNKAIASWPFSYKPWAALLMNIAHYRG